MISLVIPLLSEYFCFAFYRLVNHLVYLGIQVCLFSHLAVIQIYITGVAFILTLLDQLEEFASLNWFQSIESKCTDEMTNAASLKGSARGTIEPSIALRIAKVEQYQKVT